MKYTENAYVLLIVTLYVFLGVSVHSDYGISWDEAFQYDYGKVVYEYVVSGSDDLLAHRSRYHGPVFQAFLYGAQKLMGISDVAETYRFRHLLTFLFSVVGLIFFYRLLRELRFSSFWAMVGMVFLMASPRIYAHSFYNAKDVVFMYAFVIAIFTMLRFLRNPNWKPAAWHGIACGFLIDVRILGFFVPVFTGMFWAMTCLEDRDRWKTQTFPMALFGTVILLVMMALWPTLWHDPITEFGNAISKMSDYPWDDPILFEGIFQLPKDLPWYYLPKWIWISTPLFVLILAGIGCVLWPWGHQRTTSEKLLPFFWILLPLSVILWKDATIYDGWRHVFFIYPPLVLLAVRGAQTLLETIPSDRRIKWVAVGLALFPVSWMIRNHPNQQVYFNPLYREDTWRNYEMDYWGLSYHQAYQWLTTQKPSGQLKVAVANAPGFYNHWVLSESDRERIHFVPLDSADFFLSNFRYPAEHEAATQATGAYKHPVWILQVDGNRACGVFVTGR